MKAPPDDKAPRILLVEDQFLLALHMGEDLKLEGYHLVGPAHSVDMALDLIGSTPVDAALLDVNLGARTSYPVADALAERHIPFAFLSGYSREDLDPRYHRQVLLNKPVLPDELHRAVQELVAQARPR